jgi:hypothetical protein
MFKLKNEDLFWIVALELDVKFEHLKMGPSPQIEMLMA